MPGENLPTSRMTKLLPDESTAKFTSVAVCLDSLTNSIAMPELVETGIARPKIVCFWFLSMMGPQLLIVTGGTLAARAVDAKNAVASIAPTALQAPIEKLRLFMGPAFQKKVGKPKNPRSRARDYITGT